MLQVRSVKSTGQSHRKSSNRLSHRPPFIHGWLRQVSTSVKHTQSSMTVLTRDKGTFNECLLVKSLRINPFNFWCKRFVVPNEVISYIGRIIVYVLLFLVVLYCCGSCPLE